jgi:hypothetical protein
VDSKQQLIKRARIYDQLERASDHGIGHPGGPTGWRKPRAPPATGAAAKLRRLRKLHPELWRRVMAGELTVGRAATMAFNSKTKGHIPTKIVSLSVRWAAGLLGAAEARQLEKRWREEFFRSREPGFTYDDGVRGTLTGRAAHIAHLVLHDVPASLCEYWAASDDAA